MEFQAVRMLEIRSPGGREAPHRSLLTVVIRVFVGLEVWGASFRDILGMKWRLPTSVLLAAAVTVGANTGNWELSGEV